MTALRVVWLVAESLFLGYGGWLLTFRTSTIVRRAYSTYGYNFFLKPWYSRFMRSIGIFIWLLMAPADYAMLTLR
jgi:drug/metabolite transporter superfamily protein YnfA